VLKHNRIVVPLELLGAIDAHAHAVAAGDEHAAETFVGAPALETHRASFKRASAIRPLNGFEILARARLGFHYIVKVRFHGGGGDNVTLQNRWRQEDGGNWRIVEVEDLGLSSPWKKPDKPATANVNG
jgi:hypothetical protein